MTPADSYAPVPDARLDRECAVFYRYLTSESPDEYVRARYRAAHHTDHWRARATPGRFDALLLDRAMRSPWMTRLADTYAALFARHALLRQKLVLLLAIEESRTPAFGALETPPSRTRAGAFAALAGQGVSFAAHLACAAALFGPAHARSRRNAPPLADSPHSS